MKTIISLIVIAEIIMLSFALSATLRNRAKNAKESKSKRNIIHVDTYGQEDD